MHALTFSWRSPNRRCKRMRRSCTPSLHWYFPSWSHRTAGSNHPTVTKINKDWFHFTVTSYHSSTSLAEREFRWLTSCSIQAAARILTTPLGLMSTSSRYKDPKTTCRAKYTQNRTSLSEWHTTNTMSLIKKWVWEIKKLSQFWVLCYHAMSCVNLELYLIAVCLTPLHLDWYLYLYHFGQFLTFYVNVLVRYL